MRGSRENGDRVSTTEAAKARPSNEGGPGTCYPGKNVLDFNLLKCHSLCFRVFRTGYWPGFKIKAWKNLLLLKGYPFFSKSDRFT